MRNSADIFAGFDTATAGMDSPVAVLDWRAFNHNLADIARRAAGTPVRIASKSVRSVELLKAVLEHSEFHGVLSFSVAEALHLVRNEVTDDVVVAYPSTSSEALGELVADKQMRDAITLMVDTPAQINLLAELGARNDIDSPVRLCLDVDCSYRLFNRIHIGTRRSPLHTVDQVRTATEFITSIPWVSLVGVMGYEAQIAGVTDSSWLVRGMKKLSTRELSTRRAQLVDEVQKGLERAGRPALEFVNGGGTGSIETTTAEGVITEVAAGSGFFAPHLFDHYDCFTPQPAAFFGLDVVRKPAKDIVTLHGGGWIASGTPGKDRMPEPVWPQGLKYIGTEGAGEVQTPLKCTGEVPAIGSRVWLRHTKAGELAEHVNTIEIIDGDARIGTVKTYRGEGHAFL